MSLDSEISRSATIDTETLWERITSRIERTSSGCWLWTGATNRGGYGVISLGGTRTGLVHRVSVLADGREIPDDYQVDHSCHDSYVCRLRAECPHRRCVNPEHLDVVTAAENNRRKFDRGMCPKGHAYAKRTDGRRRCHPCEADYAARYRAGNTFTDMLGQRWTA